MPAWTAFGWKSSAIVPGSELPLESSPPQPAMQASSAITERNRRTAANSRAKPDCHGGDRSAGPWARGLYRRVRRHAVARLLHHGCRLALPDPAVRAEPAPLHRLLGDRAGPHVRALRPDPDARPDLRRALQPGRDG